MKEKKPLREPSAVTWTQQTHTLPQTLRERPGAIPALFLLSVGFGLWLQTTFPSLGVSFLLLSPLLFAAGAALLLCCGTRAEKWVYSAAALCTLLLFFIFRKSFLLLVNDFCSALQRVSGHIYLHFEADDKVVPLLAVMICGGAILLSRACASGSLLWLLPIMIPMFELALSSVVPFRAGAALFTGGMLLVFRRQGQSLRRMLGRIAAAALSLLLALCIALPLRSMPQNPVYPALQNAAHFLLYDRRSHAMPEGRLSKLKPFNKSDTPALSVTAETPQAMYLRGKVYETYTGKAWKELSGETRAGYAQLFYTLHDAQYFGQTQVASALREIGGVTTQQITVKNLTACRAHGYLPYGADSIAADDTLIGDTQIPEQETFFCFADDSSTLQSAQVKLIDTQEKHADYLALEQAFAGYTRKVDLSMTDDARDMLEREFASRRPQSASLSAVRKAIRAYLDETLVYDESAGKGEKGKDFLVSLLEGSRCGYSVHYATAAVLLLRYCGVPARYVEGYYMPENSGAEVTLTEANAHAWAEMYLDGIGFVPFEVTPGYGSDESTQKDSERKIERSGNSPAALPFNSPPPPSTPTEPTEAQPQYFPLLWVCLLLLLAAAGFAAWVLLQRRRLRRALLAIDDMEPRAAVLRRYAYTLRLRSFVPQPIHDDDDVREAVRLAQFSDHEITEAHRRTTDAFAMKVRTDCLRQWNLPRRIYYRYIRVVCL